MPTEPNLWSGSFHSIFLYSSVEHIASDTNNIKVLLNFMTKYIQGKKVNELKDFDGMEDTIWNFISLVYEFK